MWWPHFFPVLFRFAFALLFHLLAFFKGLWPVQSFLHNPLLVADMLWAGASPPSKCSDPLSSSTSARRHAAQGTQARGSYEKGRFQQIVWLGVQEVISVSGFHSVLVLLYSFRSGHLQWVCRRSSIMSSSCVFKIWDTAHFPEAKHTCKMFILYWAGSMAN